MYRIKACILDADNPAKIIGHTKDFILWPEHDYEMKCRVANVTFVCNAIPEPDGTLKIYYGAPDGWSGDSSYDKQLNIRYGDYKYVVVKQYVDLHEGTTLGGSGHSPYFAITKNSDASGWAVHGKMQVDELDN